MRHAVYEIVARHGRWCGGMQEREGCELPHSALSQSSLHRRDHLCDRRGALPVADMMRSPYIVARCQSRDPRFLR